VALRVVTVALLLVDEIAYRDGPSGFAVIVSSVVAFCLILGALTPYAAIVAAALELLRLQVKPHGDVFHTMVTVVISLSIAALGPGAYSLDCKIFGRHVVSLPSDKDDS